VWAGDDAWVCRGPCLGRGCEVLLTGVVRDTEVVDGGEVVGLAGRKAYYSQGYGVSFNDLRKVYEMFGGGYPEALRNADKLSKTAVKK
jgi:hypothetical protein